MCYKSVCFASHNRLKVFLNDNSIKNKDIINIMYAVNEDFKFCLLYWSDEE